ncbi:DUF1700 domain-containing protein [Pediococcus acidilactici]|uniref:DUF1700 domain-containing protein n=1 Tax=Pediococcus acidilactici TaxID=1254 RepID=UPI0013E8B9DD|nr:DUF1700 domain-containing protein [Pediococcus acidilactici]
MDYDEYKRRVIQHFKEISLKKDVRHEILVDLQEFFDNSDQDNSSVEERLGTPNEFVDSYIDKNDLDKPTIHKIFRVLFRSIIYILSVICCILTLSPLIWVIAFVFQLNVEIGYFFQFIVSILLFIVGFGGLYIFWKQDWL